jgi:ribonuclease HI
MLSSDVRHLAAIRRLGASTWGTELTDIRDIYSATVLPTYLYCSSVWANSAKARTTLDKVQYQTGKLIAGAYKQTAKVELEAELQLPPIDIRLKGEVERTLIRMASVKQGRTLLQHSSANQGKSPLANHLLQFEQDHGKGALEIDTRKGFIIPPWASSLGITTRIEPNKEEAEKVHSQLVTSEGIHIYTDGSGIDGCVGAAMYCLETRAQSQSSLGPMDSATVYTGELQGLILALEYVLDQERITPVYIFTDNQAVIWTSNNPNAAVAQNYLARIHELLEQILCPIQLRWIPAHIGIPGNEIVDVLAKQATGWRGERMPRGPAAPTPPYALTNQHWFRGRVKLAARTRWQERYRKEVTAKQYKRIFKNLAEVDLDGHKRLPRAISSIIVQMRTGKIGLRQYLHTMKVPDIEDPFCYECLDEWDDTPLQPQTVEHILFQCRAFQDLRNDLRRHLQDGTLGLRGVLGNTNGAVAAALFMAKTRLLNHTEGVAEDAELILQQHQQQLSRVPNPEGEAGRS